MPVVFKQTLNASLFIEVWNFTESEAFFWKQLSLNEQDKQHLLSLSLPTRRLEKMACRMALQDILQTHSIDKSAGELQYSAIGAPLLRPYQLSFSHCKSYAAVAFSVTNPIGIDIEKIGGRLQKLYAHFMNNDEIADCDMTSDTDLHFYWGAKEAVYKAYSLGHIDYLHDIRILRSESKGILHKDGEVYIYRLWDKKIGDNYIVIAYS